MLLVVQIHKIFPLKRYSYPKKSSNDLSDKADATFVNIPRQVTSKKRKICNTIGDYIVNTSTLEAKLLDEQIAQYFYATNTPFVAVEHPEFVKLISMLRSGYSPTSPYDVGGKLLDKVQYSLMNTCDKHLKIKQFLCPCTGGAMFTTNRLCASVSQLIKQIRF